MLILLAVAYFGENGVIELQREDGELREVMFLVWLGQRNGNKKVTRQVYQSKELENAVTAFCGELSAQIREEDDNEIAMKRLTKGTQ